MLRPAFPELSSSTGTANIFVDDTDTANRRVVRMRQFNEMSLDATRNIADRLTGRRNDVSVTPSRKEVISNKGVAASIVGVGDELASYFDRMIDLEQERQQWQRMMDNRTLEAIKDLVDVTGNNSEGGLGGMLGGIPGMIAGLGAALGASIAAALGIGKVVKGVVTDATRPAKNLRRGDKAAASAADNVADDMTKKAASTADNMADDAARQAAAATAARNQADDVARAIPNPGLRLGQFDDVGTRMSDDAMRITANATDNLISNLPRIDYSQFSDVGGRMLSDLHVPATVVNAAPISSLDNSLKELSSLYEEAVSNTASATAGAAVTRSAAEATPSAVRTGLKAAGKAAVVGGVVLDTYEALKEDGRATKNNDIVGSILGGVAATPGYLVDGIGIAGGWLENKTFGTNTINRGYQRALDMAGGSASEKGFGGDMQSFHKAWMTGIADDAGILTGTQTANLIFDVTDGVGLTNSAPATIDDAALNRQIELIVSDLKGFNGDPMQKMHIQAAIDKIADQPGYVEAQRRRQDIDLLEMDFWKEMLAMTDEERASFLQRSAGMAGGQVNSYTTGGRIISGPDFIGPMPQTQPTNVGPGSAHAQAIAAKLANATGDAATNDYLLTTAFIESKFDPNAVSSTGATGILQFTKGTGKDYGLVTGNGDHRRNVDASIAAGIKLTEAGKRQLQQAGLPVTPENLYMVHQLGIGGGPQLLKAALGQGGLGNLHGAMNVNMNESMKQFFGGDVRAYAAKHGDQATAAAYTKMWGEKYRAHRQEAYQMAGLSGGSVTPPADPIAKIEATGRSVPETVTPNTSAGSGDLSGIIPAHAGVDLAGLTPQTKSALSSLQSSFGGSLTINSAYRSPEKNASVGGATGSQHMQGKAVDISTRGMDDLTKRSLLSKAMEAGFTSFGFYPTFMHADTRAGKARWVGGGMPGIPAWATDVLNNQGPVNMSYMPDEGGITQGNYTPPPGVSGADAGMGDMSGGMSQVMQGLAVAQSMRTGVAMDAGMNIGTSTQEDAAQHIARTNGADAAGIVNQPLPVTSTSPMDLMPTPPQVAPRQSRSNSNQAVGQRVPHPNVNNIPNNIDDMMMLGEFAKGLGKND